MASITNTTITNYDYLLRNCYSSNRTARKAVGRATLKKDELISADANAIKKITKNLRELEYSAENGTNVYNNIKAFVESYNNLLESTEDSASPKIARAIKNLKKTVKEQSDALEEIGIKIAASGDLKIDKKTLFASKPSKVRNVLSSSNDFTTNVRKYATDISRTAKTLLQTGNAQNKKTANTLEDIPGLTQTANIMTSTSIDYKA